MKCTFETALAGKLDLIPLSHNIGYIACEKYHFSEEKHSSEHDLVHKYYLIENPRRSCTWLYEIDGSFFIEITPKYPWEFCEPEPGEQYISYEKFMTSYKSILTTPLERADIELLYQQTSKLADETLARERKKSGFDITQYLVHDEAES